MMQRAWFGWSLVGAFCAVVSCGGGSGSGPKGFGVACKDDAACQTYDLVCGEGKCVQCLGDTDCRSSEVCSAGLCKAQQDCDDSRDCSGAQVCDEDLGACVDCLSNDDCKTGQACMGHNCHDRPSCDFTSDCDGGLVCYAADHICVTCRDDGDCGRRRVCVEYECVDESSSSAGKGGGGGSGNAGSGAGGTASVGGGGKGGAGDAGRGNGGAGAVSGGGQGGNGGSVNEGGAANSDECGCVDNQACTPDLRCVEPTLIDDLLDCDDQIIAIEGRQGNWAADADTGVNLMYGFSNPGSGWVDNTCAAWATGGEISANDPNTTFAFIGFRLNVDALDEAHVYDLSNYTGVHVKLESDSEVQVVLKTSGGGYFEQTLAPLPGSNVRTVQFAMLKKMLNSLENLPVKLATVTEIQFSVVDPSAFGLAVHRVELY